MAERLAPEQTPLRVTSRPERARGRTRRLGRRLVALVLSVALLAAGTVATLHFLAIHRSAQELRATALIPPEMAANVLVVLARPGQELPLAGTLAALDEGGATVAVLSLTDGAGQPPELEFAEDGIGEVRSDELASSGDLLGVDRVTTAAYTDGELLAAPPAEVTATITAEIAEVAPSVILTVGDTTGTDTDSQAVAAYVLTAAQAKGSGVGRVWTVTRGDREVSWNALAKAPIGDRVPAPLVSVRIDDRSTVKGEVLGTHGTQSPDLVRATYPYADQIPPWAYFRFWDREYFALTWGQPLQ
ncbi:MAG TPA: PIG-L family deacetylase [Motilibacterales bacterium]|nr:PIG-L family deacetylase [Motilibacterales bacterium]